VIGPEATSVGGLPGIANGPALGTAPPAPTILGNDNAGQIALSTGVAPGLGLGAMCTVTFATPYAAPPKAVMLMPFNSFAAAQATIITAVVLSATQFEVVANGVLPASTGFNWYYVVIG
jgi:hypothetical protein